MYNVGYDGDEVLYDEMGQRKDRGDVTYQMLGQLGEPKYEMAAKDRDPTYDFPGRDDPQYDMAMRERGDPQYDNAATAGKRGKKPAKDTEVRTCARG